MTLADRYRRLLLCYPRRYRQARGDEIVGTLLELAPPGRTRPTPREAVNLVRHGLRCQLGRPASRAVVVWAALATLVCALFAGAAGSWIGWQTARPLPDRAEAARLFTEVLGSPADTEIHLSPALFVIYEQPLTWRSIPTLMSFDGAEYQQGAATIGLAGPAPAHLQDRLRAQGWRVSGTTKMAAYVAPERVLFTARRADDILEIEVSAAELSTRLTRATPWAVYPIGAVAGLLGAAAGWWLFGWASRRTEYRGYPVRVASRLLFGFALMMWWLPIAVTFPSMAGHHLDETHFSWHPMWEWLGQPAGIPLFTAGAAAALLALGLAALPRRDANPRAAEIRSTPPAGAAQHVPP